MPSVTYNGQSFAIDGRRCWILGASLQYARIPQALWRARLTAAKQCGFNAIETSAVWALHEPRKGRYVFDEQADIRKFMEAAWAEGLRVILRAGPFVGHGFDGGGIPGWLIDMMGGLAPPENPRSTRPPSLHSPGLREANEVFLEHVSRYFRKLLGEVSDLQATSDGPLLLVQAEHAWACSNPLQAEKYLHEITRFIRESGINVPVINANDLWQDSPGTIDTWRGHKELLFHLRQLRTVQPTAPRLVSEFQAAGLGTWGGAGAASGRAARHEAAEDFSAQTTLEQLAEVLAAGAQAIVAPFHGGTNFGFLGGRRAGAASAGGASAGAANFALTSVGGTVEHDGESGPPLGEAGQRGEKYNLIKRLITFANHFSGVFTELDPEYQPIALDPREALSGPAASSSSSASRAASVVSLRGTQGRAIFIFSRPASGSAAEHPLTLALDNGLRLPIYLGDQSVAWTVLDADLQGAGRLDYSNVAPWAVIDRSIIVFHGPEKSPVFLSIDGTPLEATVPAGGAGSKPLVIDHHGLTVVILNRAQIDATYHNTQSVYVGIAGLDTRGQPIAAADWPKPWIISAGARLEPLAIAHERASASKPALTLGPWHATHATPHVAGSSPRFASLEGPATLSDCGAPSGYGWYRVKFNAAGRHMVMLPLAGDRLHLYLNGQPLRLVGVGPGAKSGAFEIKFDKGEQTLVALADNFGRFCEGNDLGRRKGLFGHIYAVKPIRGKAKIASAKAVSPFVLRGFIEGRASDQPSDDRQAIWTFQHPRKTAVIIDISGARASGTFVLNNTPLAYYAGETGGCADCLLLEPDDTPALKRGSNVLRFAPDMGQGDAGAQDVADHTSLYEATDVLTEKGEWSFAKWEPPPASASGKSARAAGGHGNKPPRHQPCWWHTTVEVDAALAASDRALWLDVGSMSKGQAFINGHNLGRYFSATGEGRAVGPQTRLYVPSPWLKPGPANDLLLFDEHGFEPTKVRLVRG
jgi:beta-galactosidase